MIRKGKFSKGRIFCLFLLFSLFFLRDISFSLADTQDIKTERFTGNLKSYFHSYYSRILEKGLVKSKQDVFKELDDIFRDSQISVNGKIAIKENETAETLVDLFNSCLENEKKSINLFVIDRSDIVNCWLGDLLDLKIERRSVWGQEVEAESRTIGNLVISDFIDFSTRHKEAIDVGVRGNTIYYNLDAYRRRAEEIWDLLLKNSRQKGRRYNIFPMAQFYEKL